MGIETTDLWLASYLRFKGFGLKDYEVIRRGKVRYIFDISEEDYKLMKLEFLSHDISNIKQTMEQLKDLGY